MTKTTLQNTTNGTIILNESQAGILRKLGEVTANESFVVRSQLNQTYKEYLCVSKNSNQFTLSSDDLSEWKEILIKSTKLRSSDAEKLVWEGKLARSKPATRSPAQNSPLKRLGNWVGGWFRASPQVRGPSAPTASGGGPSVPTASGGGQSVPTASGGGPSVPTASGGGLSVPTATGGGLSVPTATGGGPSVPTTTGVGLSAPTATSVALPPATSPTTAVT